MKKYLLIILCVLASAAFAEVYKWTDANGRVHYGDNPKEGDNAEQVKLQINSYEAVTVTDYTPSAEATESKKPKRVIMYSTEWCGYCKKAAKYFRENNIAFTEYDIEKDPAAKKRYDALGAKGVPVILVGSKRMNGFSVAGFNNIYQ